MKPSRDRQLIRAILSRMYPDREITEDMVDGIVSGKIEPLDDKAKDSVLLKLLSKPDDLARK